jgi:hypothetical protein
VASFDVANKICRALGAGSRCGTGEAAAAVALDRYGLHSRVASLYMADWERAMVGCC